MMERWRDIPGWEGLYQASDQGRIRSVDRVVLHPRGGPKRLKGRILSPRPNNKVGHLAVGLWVGGVEQSKRVHQLVALTWIGPCPVDQQVRHGQNGHLDNSVSNLCYGTRSQDSLDKRRDGTHSGRAVRRSDGMEFISMWVAAEESGCSHKCIWMVCQGQRKTTGGYGWEYVEEDSTGPDCPGCVNPGSLCDVCEYTNNHDTPGGLYR